MATGPPTEELNKAQGVQQARASTGDFNQLRSFNFRLRNRHRTRHNHTRQCRISCVNVHPWLKSLQEACSPAAATHTMAALHSGEGCLCMLFCWGALLHLQWLALGQCPTFSSPTLTLNSTAQNIAEHYEHSLGIAAQAQNQTANM
jgi:hypothetical protein